MPETKLSELLEGMSDKYDKRPGHLVYDFMVPVAKAIEESNNKIDIVETKLDVRELKGDELDLYITQNSDKTRHAETYANVPVILTGDCSIKTGDIVETASGIQFEFIEDVEVVTSSTVVVKAKLPGTSGNVRANTITQIPITIQGLISVNNTEDAKDGFDKETDQYFLDRFLESEQAEETQGNKAQHKAWVKSVQGVGEANVYPLQNQNGDAADNSVLTVIVDSNIMPASADLVNTVQEILNPLAENGHGSGLAPLGCYAYIKSAEALYLSVTFNAVLASGATTEIASESVKDKIKEYLKTVYREKKIVSFAQVGVSILSADEVDDYSNLQINGDSTNISVPDKSVAVIDSVVIS